MKVPIVSVHVLIFAILALLTATHARPSWLNTLRREPLYAPKAYNPFYGAPDGVRGYVYAGSGPQPTATTTTTSVAAPPTPTELVAIDNLQNVADSSTLTLSDMTDGTPASPLKKFGMGIFHKLMATGTKSFSLSTGNINGIIHGGTPQSTGTINGIIYGGTPKSTGQVLSTNPAISSSTQHSIMPTSNFSTPSGPTSSSLSHSSGNITTSVELDSTTTITRTITRPITVSPTNGSNSSPTTISGIPFSSSKSSAPYPFSNMTSSVQTGTGASTKTTAISSTTGYPHLSSSSSAVTSGNFSGIPSSSMPYPMPNATSTFAFTGSAVSHGTVPPTTASVGLTSSMLNHTLSTGHYPIMTLTGTGTSLAEASSSAAPYFPTANGTTALAYPSGSGTGSLILSSTASSAAPYFPTVNGTTALTYPSNSGTGLPSSISILSSTASSYYSAGNSSLIPGSTGFITASSSQYYPVSNSTAGPFVTATSSYHSEITESPSSIHSGPSTLSWSDPTGNSTPCPITVGTAYTTGPCGSLATTLSSSLPRYTVPGNSTSLYSLIGTFARDPISFSSETSVLETTQASLTSLATTSSSQSSLSKKATPTPYPYYPPHYGPPRKYHSHRHSKYEAAEDKRGESKITEAQIEK